ncbi:HIT family protein [Candidatus Saccharibacteria bacterium]|nr:HIT family protein [Candidatus Saccharibacteria bacterium]
MSDTIFDRIARGEMSAWTVWQDDHHMAFLTPFPNTPGLTVVIPKNNVGDDVVELDEADFLALQLAVQKVAKILKKALGVARVAIVYEGTGVAYVHAKLYPLHGVLAAQTDVWSKETEFVEEYRGWLSTIEGPKMADEKLDEIQAKILEAVK